MPATLEDDTLTGGRTPSDFEPVAICYVGDGHSGTSSQSNRRWSNSCGSTSYADLGSRTRSSLTTVSNSKEGLGILQGAWDFAAGLNSEVPAPQGNGQAEVFIPDNLKSKAHRKFVYKFHFLTKKAVYSCTLASLMR